MKRLHRVVEQTLLMLVPATPISMMLVFAKEGILQSFPWIILQWFLVWVSLYFFYEVGGFGQVPPACYINKWKW